MRIKECLGQIHLLLSRLNLVDWSEASLKFLRALAVRCRGWLEGLRSMSLRELSGFCLVFLPGVNLICLGGALMFYPPLLRFFLATFLISFGALFIWGTFIGLILLRQVSVVLKGIERGLVLQAVSVSEDKLNDIFSRDEKKTVMH